MAELEQAPKAVDEPVACDWLLQILISVTNSSGTPCPVTLHVGGLLVSGELVSGLQYFEEFAQQMGSAVKESEREEIEAMFREMGQSFYSQEKSPDAPPPPNPHFIHLQNVKIFNPEGLPFPSNDGAFWRGRVEAVDGFMLGSLTPKIGGMDAGEIVED
jgi:hypothetical protein